MADNKAPWRRELNEDPIRKGEDGIPVPGIEGKWHTIDDAETKYGPELWLLEEDEWGDEWPLTIVDKWGYLVLANCYNGFDDLDDSIANGDIRIEKFGNPASGVQDWKIYRAVDITEG